MDRKSDMKRSQREYPDARTLFIDLTQWELAVHCRVPHVLSSVKAQFGDRAAWTSWVDRVRLDCDVMSDPRSYEELCERISFSGPTVRASRNVNITYAFERGRTWLHVAETAVLELDDSTPTRSRVYLRPELDADSPPITGSKRLVADPEAFLYPLLAEWIRNFSACLMHCGAVAMGDRAVVLSGPPGSGKSTHVLRLLLHGVQFLADDLAIIHRGEGGLEMIAFREVANVGRRTIEHFPELRGVAGAPLRGDGKYCVDVPAYFGQHACRRAAPGAIVRLHPDTEQWMERCPREDHLDGIHAMAWFVSAGKRSEQHFWLISDWLTASSQWNVSQGYLTHHLDAFLDRIRLDLGAA
ncbi:MAG: hypothetical protein JW955_00465 [Sedimentisphaerales bacterium]|nr:hypothetical protein [Sedimentisphaerales bacterium]